MGNAAATRWQGLTGDPNTPEAYAYRRRVLASAHRPPVRGRVDYLKEVARGRRVLDVGVVGHCCGDQPGTDWTHGKVAAAAAYCLGVDIVADEVRKLQELGHNVRLCDITRETLGERFDVIICGEVIEHLGHPAGLFQGALRHLLPGGRLVITTPNPYALWRIKHFLRGQMWENVDHVALMFPGGIAELAEREGMRLDRYCGVAEVAWTWKSRLLLRGMPLLKLAGICPEAVCETMVYECVRADEVPTG